MVPAANVGWGIADPIILPQLELAHGDDAPSESARNIRLGLARASSRRIQTGYGLGYTDARQGKPMQPPAPTTFADEQR